MEHKLASLGIAAQYDRFPAVDGRTIRTSSNRSPGEVGCFRSHLDVLTMAADSRRAVHVMEDDVLLCDLTVPAIDSVVRGRAFRDFDIVFLEMSVTPTLESIRALHALFEKSTNHGSVPIIDPKQLRIIDVQNQYRYGTTSYVVGAKSIDRVLGILEAAWSHGPVDPIDVVIQDAARAGQLRLGCCFPFVTSIDLHLTQASTADRKAMPEAALVRQILRYAFYVRRKIDGYAVPAIQPVLKKWERPDPDGAIDLYMKVLRCLLLKP